MIPLIVLLSVFFLLLGFYKITRLALSAMLMVTASGHFIFPKTMALMIPEFIPFPVFWIYLTGIFEIVAAVALHISKFRVLTGWLLIIFMILVLPANIYAAFIHLDYQTGTYDGDGPGYLWFRIPFQVLLIFWTYWSAVKWKV